MEVSQFCIWVEWVVFNEILEQAFGITVTQFEGADRRIELGVLFQYRKFCIAFGLGTRFLSDLFYQLKLLGSSHVFFIIQ
ncbi:hypothetical protein D3C86_2058540 [compost metagenome]